MNGLENRYFGLRRSQDGTEVEGWYFVLRDNDPSTPAALRAYAEACGNPALRDDLEAKAGHLEQAVS